MDSRDLSRRSYEHPGYASTQGYGTGLRATSGSGSERFSPVHGQQLPPTRTATSGSASRPSSQPQGFGPYGLQQSRGQYQQHGLPSSPYQYSDFGTPESQRQQQAQQQTPQSQQFSSFPTNMVFSVPSQMSQGSSFETSLPTYQSRAPTSLEALTSHLAMSQQQQPPQQQQFYNTCDAPSVSAQAYASAGPYRAQPGIYRSNTRDHRASAASETSGYQADVAEYTQFAMSNPVEQQQQQQQGQRGDDIQGQGGGGGGEEEDYAAYNENLRQTFQDVLDGRLVDAGQQLLNISEWLVNNAANLGLTHDDQEQQERRLQLWTNFNHCWLAVVQKQKDMTLAMMENGQPLPSTQSVLQEPFLERMGRDLVTLCDTMEHHGLVDYQMGIWEEEIMNVIMECLDLLEPPDEPTSSNAPPGTSAGQR